MLSHGSVAVLALLFAAPPVPAVPAYVIEAPDILKIEVTGLPRKAQPIRGERLVRPDGTVSLGKYGSALVSGRTPDQVRAVVVQHLAGQVKKKRADQLAVRVEVAAVNSKFYYLVVDDQVYRLSCAGNETVTDAIGQVKGAAELAAKGHVWVARPRPQLAGPEQILTVDWKAITRQVVTATNYPLLPGDRVFVQPRPAR